jgi:hypothetical protein
MNMKDVELIIFELGRQVVFITRGTLAEYHKKRSRMPEIMEGANESARKLVTFSILMRLLLIGIHLICTLMHVHPIQ